MGTPGVSVGERHSPGRHSKKSPTALILAAAMEEQRRLGCSQRRLDGAEGDTEGLENPHPPHCPARPRGWLKIKKKLLKK